MSLAVKVRMYRLHELGDCFLLRIKSGSQNRHMLIDCGSFRNGAASIARLAEVTESIRSELNGQPLDVVVGTHQHNDHLSGFVHHASVFKSVGVEQVWLSWLDDPADKLAQGIGEFHHNLAVKLAGARTRLGGRLRHPEAERVLDSVDDMLGVLGARTAAGPPELPANAVKLLRGLGKQKPAYLRPGQTRAVPGLSLDNIQVHVLGPPRIPGNRLLYRKDPREGESYDFALKSLLAGVDAFADAADAQRGIINREEATFPFTESYKARGHADKGSTLRAIQERYRRRLDEWRSIDRAWLEQAEALALYLDTFTNNSSLVLAIELKQSGKVLLFAADAQTGNWLSWDSISWESPSIETDDLLARTVFYKVGHHGSHNSTLVAMFEKMTHPDLVALIPVHKKDPMITKQNGWRMPARNLLKRLAERTQGRALQMDGVNPASCNPQLPGPKASWKKVGVLPKSTPLYIECEFRG